MHRCKKTSFLYLIFLFTALVAKGQIASSPFSEYGIGDLQNGGIAQNQGMGGIGISNPHPAYINNLNPALLVFNQYTMFQGGMQIESKKITDGHSSQSFKNGNLNYLVVALPVKINRWTTSFGLTPYSNVNYNISSQTNADGTTNINYTRPSIGKGGLNLFYWSNGVRINKYLSLGTKMSYMFGVISTQDGSTLTGASANTLTYRRDSFHGVNLTGGIHFHKDSLFGKNYTVNFGAVYSLQSTLKAQHITKLESILPSGGIIDSLTLENLGGKLKIPKNFGFGFSFGKIDQWTVGFDFTYLDYRSFDYRTVDHKVRYKGVPSIGYRSGFGIEITPDLQDVTNYFNRITYRAGFSYEKSPVLIFDIGKVVTDLGGTFGASLPVSRFSTIDVGCKIGRRGTISQDLIQENYFRIFFGITFLDKWFIKRKFD